MSDLRAKGTYLYGSDSGKAILKVLFADSTPTMIFYRLMQASDRMGIGPLSMIFNRIISIFCQSTIGRGADFGPGLVMLQAGIMVNGKVKGGHHITLTHQLTIGEEKNHAPVIGNHVLIGAGARIVGPVKIGNYTKIGVNAVVLADVPDGATVFGIPAKVVWKDKVPKDAA